MRTKSIIAVLLLSCVALCGAQTTTDRHIDFTQKLQGFDGKPITTGDPKSPETMTLSDAAVGALETPLETDRSDDGNVKFKRDTLARKIYKAKSVELTVEELKMIMDRIGKVYGPMVVGAAWPLLDPAMKAEK